MTVILDGGLATQIEAQGFDIANPLWSASLLLDNPRAIVDAHRAFLDAGAEILITASYQASRQGFVERGLSAARADELMGESVRLAALARDEFLAAHPGEHREIRIAASIGPYGAAVLHDGSEYTGVYNATPDQIRTLHEDRLAVLDAAGADLLACETIPNIDEATVLAELLNRARTPAWISFCCRDAGHLSDGTPVEQAAALFADHAHVFAVGVNCTAPQFVPSLIGRLRQAAPGKKIVVYPNSGESYRASDKTWHGTATPQECATAAREWQAAGADIIGGCCRMGPQHISAIRSALGERE